MIAPKADGTLDSKKYWFNTDNFEKDSARTPTSVQTRASSFQIDGLRGPGLTYVNMNLVRNFKVAGRATFKARVDIQNLLNYRRWQCAGCRYQVSLTAGTILHNTKTALTVWFWATSLTVTDKRGMSALLLQRQLGLRRYETAWMLLHKLRRAMVNTGREPLHGEVEIDDTWRGGPQAGLQGSRQLRGRRVAVVLVAAEKRGTASGRVRMAVIPDFKATTLTSFIAQHIAPGSTICTDGLKHFTGLPAKGYSHVPRTQPRSGELRRGAKSVVPLADRAIGNLQQWLVGTHHGVSRGQLQVYLDEFVFRHNRRRTPAAAFQTLLGLGSGRAPTPYRQIRGARDLSGIGGI